jgi:hypothetical protein
LTGNYTSPCAGEVELVNEIIFKTRGIDIIKRIISVSTTGKTIQIDHPDLQNSLEIVKRKVHVIL